MLLWENKNICIPTEQPLNTAFGKLLMAKLLESKLTDVFVVLVVGTKDVVSSLRAFDRTSEHFSSCAAEGLLL